MILDLLFIVICLMLTGAFWPLLARGLVVVAALGLLALPVLLFGAWLVCANSGPSPADMLPVSTVWGTTGR